VVIDAGGMHQRRLAEPRRFFDGFNKPSALSEAFGHTHVRRPNPT
jgi:hypothetical protein